MKLVDRSAKDINKKSPPLSYEKIKKYFSELEGGWKVGGGKKLKRDFEFESFMQGLKFVNKVAEIAEGQNHHPDIHLFYKKVTIELSTHAIGGLSENDFILAAKIDRLEN